MKRVMLGLSCAMVVVVATANAQGGTVTGSVKFTGTPPANPKIDMTEEPTCKAKNPNAVDPVVVVNKGMLANVFVYVKSGLPAGAKYPAPTTPVVLDQSGCLYTPRIIGAMIGQPIEIRNSDAVLHNIKAVPKKNRPFNISQPSQGMKTTRTFPAAEAAIPLECNVHGWMHAKTFVMDHPFFAVSGADGSFTLKGLPAGTYTIEAWHEKLGTKTATVTVAANGTATSTFTFGT
jgi:hypothetical protein